MSASPRKIIPLVPLNPLGPPEQKIQASAVTGRHARWRWAMVWLTQAFFYGLPWLNFNQRQAVLFDVAGGRFYLFGAVLYPQDLIYLTALLVLCALLLFAATALAGRVWCGFACPQTVYTQIFQWLELRIEGDRLARMRLDAQAWDAGKLRLRTGKHLAWAAVSLWTGLTFVGWFTPIRDLSTGLLTASGIGPWEVFWVLFYSLATYGNAGYLREKVCQHMCPYGRFQGSMLDRDTLIVGYDSARGEPRGARARGSDAQALKLGSCVDCTICVQVCPVGIDIREGLQAPCISCGLCIDACDTVMDKLQAPRGLIRFASQRELAGEAAAVGWRAQWRRPRVRIYAALLLGVSAALMLGFASRPTLRVDAIRDRGVLARQGEDGRITNVYRLQVMNASERARRIEVRVDGTPGLQVDTQVGRTLLAAQALTLPVTLSLPPAQAVSLAGRIVPIRLRVVDLDHAAQEFAAADSTFVIPH